MSFPLERPAPARPQLLPALPDLCAMHAHTPVRSPTPSKPARSPHLARCQKPWISHLISCFPSPHYVPALPHPHTPSQVYPQKRSS